MDEEEALIANQMVGGEAMPQTVSYPGGFHPRCWNGTTSDLYPRIRDHLGWIWLGLWSHDQFRREFAETLVELVADNWPHPWEPKPKPRPKPPKQYVATAWPTDSKRHYQMVDRIRKAKKWHYERWMREVAHK